MKCQRCNGTGLVYNSLGDFEEDCGFCHGTGNVAEPHTNEAWFCGLSTEEKADFFCTVQHCLTIYGDHIATIEDWEKCLKEKHHE